MELTYDILEKAKSIIKYNFDLIKEDYPYISEQEAIIISSYSCESIFPDYSPYKILNKNLNEEDRLKGIKNISKYLFIFLNSLRKLRKYYPKGKYMYRCINKKVNLEQDIFNNKISPIKKDDTLTTYGFISLTSEKNTIYNYKGKKINIDNGTVFEISGNFYGYDISLFHKLCEEHIILEPEHQIKIKNVVSKFKYEEIINIRCEINFYSSILKIQYAIKK